MDSRTTDDLRTRAEESHRRSGELLHNVTASATDATRAVAELRQELGVAREKIANLEQALVTARRIGAAVGIVMARLSVTEDEAFLVLRSASQREQRKLRVIADEIVFTGVIPDQVA